MSGALIEPSVTYSGVGNTLLNDGRRIPNLAFGTGSVMKYHDVTGYVLAALNAGFKHLDTAQVYETEESVGKGLQKWMSKNSDNYNDTKNTQNTQNTSQYPSFKSIRERKSIWVTTKYSGGSKGPLEELKDSLDKLKLDYVDLYLIHHPMFIHGSVEDAWREFEQAKELGLAKSIGVSNYGVEGLKEIVKIAKMKPVVNQIQFHPYNYEANLEIIKYCRKHDIIIEAYSPLYPITQRPDGPVTGALTYACTRLNATPAQVLFLWVRAKGAVVVTTTSKEERLHEYLGIANLGPLTDEEVATIDAAGASAYLPSNSWSNASNLEKGTGETVPENEVKDERTKLVSRCIYTLALAWFLWKIYGWIVYTRAC